MSECHRGPDRATCQEEVARLIRERDAWKQRALYEEESRLTIVRNLFQVLAEHGETPPPERWMADD